MCVQAIVLSLRTMKTAGTANFSPSWRTPYASMVFDFASDSTEKLSPSRLTSFAACSRESLLIATTLTPSSSRRFRFLASSPS
jgi:hypothetical protein